MIMVDVWVSWEHELPCTPMVIEFQTVISTSFAASDPAITHNMTTGGALAGETVRMTCSVTYQGLWGPISAWTRNSAAMSAVNESLVAGNSFVSQYSIYFSAVSADNGAVYSCRTYFDTVTVSDPNHMASNPPVYTNSSSLTLAVLCKFCAAFVLPWFSQIVFKYYRMTVILDIVCLFVICVSKINSNFTIMNCILFVCSLVYEIASSLSCWIERHLDYCVVFKIMCVNMFRPTTEHCGQSCANQWQQLLPWRPHHLLSHWQPSANSRVLLLVGHDSQ